MPDLSNIFTQAGTAGSSLVSSAEGSISAFGTNALKNSGNLIGALGDTLSHKFLGGLGVGLFGGNNTYFGDAKHAPYNFGVKNSYYVNNTPRLAFQYYAKFVFNDNVKSSNGSPFVSRFLNTQERQALIPLVKSIEMPSASIDTTVLNQYNRKRIAQTKIHYNPITLVLHDVVDGKSLRLWEMYYEYYFKDAVQINDQVTGNKVTSYSSKSPMFSTPNIDDTLTSSIDPDYGYNTDTVQNNKHLISRIEIYQVHGGRFSLVSLINPRITDFKHDTLKYDKNDLLELTFTIDYEIPDYTNYFIPFVNSIYNDEMKSIYQYSSVPELDGFNPPKPDVHLRTRDIYEPPIPKLFDPAHPDLSVLGNLETNIGNIIKDLPGQFGNAVGASIFTGKFKNPINVQDIKKELLHNAAGETKGVASRVFASTAKAATQDVIDVFRTKS